MQTRPSSFLWRLIAALFLLVSVCAHCQSLDKALSEFAEKLSAQVKESGRKKITILDFSDLKGKTTELGRFLAEQLSVSMIEHRSGFSVMDRANINTILAEHKLTVQGLVDPANAKQLATFSGVDAIVLGSVTVLEQEVAVTAKIIATDTAEIVGASKARLPMGKELGQFLSDKPGAEPADKGSEPAAAPATAKVISAKHGDLSVAFESMRNLGRNTLVVNLILQNKSKKKTLGVAVYANRCAFSTCPLHSTLISNSGVEYQSFNDGLTGLSMMSDDPQRLNGIEPGEEVKVALKFSTQKESVGSSSSFRFQADFVVDANYSADFYAGNRSREELLGRCNTVNFVLDLPAQQ